MKEITLKLDSDRKDKHQITSQGFLVVDANLTRAGVFDYYDKDGKLVRELRSPEEVFKQESLDSLKFAPLTKHHPKEMVDSNNVKKVQIGMVGENISKRGDFVAGKIVIQDKKEIEEILDKWDRGESIELSMGYDAEVVDISGDDHKDGAFDKMQTNILYNHGSIVDRGRAGREVRLIMDEASKISENKSKKDTEVVKMKIRRDAVTVGKLKLDSIMEDVDDSAKGVVATLGGHIDSAVDALGFMQKDHDALQAKHDETIEIGKKLQSKCDELSDPTSEVVQLMIKERLDLEAVAAKVEVKTNGDDGKVKDSKALKVDVITKVHSDFKSDEKSDDYITARYDAVVELLVAQKDDKAKTSFAGFKKDAKNSEGKEKKEPRQDFKEKMKDYHKQDQK